jgi:hypothetical protein
VDFFDWRVAEAARAAKATELQAAEALADSAHLHLRFAQDALEQAAAGADKRADDESSASAGAPEEVGGRHGGWANIWPGKADEGHGRCMDDD